MADDTKKELEELTKTAEERRASALQLEAVLKRQRDNLKEMGADSRVLLELDEKIKDAKNDQLELEHSLTEELEEQLRASVLLLETSVKNGSAAQSELDAAREQLANIIERNVESQKALDILQRKRDLETDSEGFADRFLKSTLGINMNMVSAEQIMARTLKIVEKTALIAQNPEFLGIATALKMVQATAVLNTQMDQGVVNFRKQTGASGELDSVIRGLSAGLIMAGITSDEASQSVQALFLNVTGFTEYSKETQTALGATVAMLNEVGVSSENTSKNIQFAIKVLGQTPKEAAKLQRELHTFAQDLGVATDKMAGDYAKMGPTIAALGDQGTEAFRSLQVQMKATGLQMDTILSLTGQFDKFDTAAQSVGKLNALLGGPYLNTLELVAETDPSKRMEILSDRVLDAGVSFDQLDYYQKKAYTSALGLNSEMELAMFLGGNMDQIRPPEKSAAELEEIAATTQQFNTVLTELKQIGMSLAVTLGPLISKFKDLLQFIQKFAPIIAGIATAVSFAGTAIMLKGVASLYAFATGSTAAATALGGFKIIIMKGLIPALMNMGRAVWASLGPWGMLAGLLVTIGGYFMVKLASPGLITIIGMVTLALFGMGFAVLAFSGAITPAIPTLLAFGAALFVIGSSIGIAAVGIGYMADKVSTFTTGLADTMIATAVAIRDIVDAINELSGTKALAFGVAMAPVAAVAMSPAGMIAGAAMAAVTRGAGGSEESAAPAAAGGKPAIIHVHLEIDGDEFATVVNKVEVEGARGGTRKGALYDSIYDIVGSSFVEGT